MGMTRINISENMQRIAGHGCIYNGSRAEASLDIATYVSKQGRAPTLDLTYTSHRENEIRGRAKEEREEEAIMPRDTHLRAQRGGAGGGRCLRLWDCVFVCVCVCV